MTGDKRQICLPEDVKVQELDVSDNTIKHGHELFQEEWATKEDVQKLRKQLRAVKVAQNMASNEYGDQIEVIKKMARMAQRANGVCRDLLKESKDETANILRGQYYRLAELEAGFQSLDRWAGDVAATADPDALWQDVAEKDNKILKLETEVTELRKCSMQ